MTASSTDTNVLLESALSYAKRGWPVVPLHTPRTDGSCDCGKTDCDKPGKHPRTQHGFKDATTDEATIRRWWSMWPTANVAIPTGAASGFNALDVDPRHGGDESLSALEVTHGNLPITPEAKTGGGGRHILFKHPGRPCPCKIGLAPGLDIKGDGGYIVVEPSLHASGRRYSWDAGAHPDDIPLADPPPWLLSMLEEKKPKGPAASTGGEIREGERNSTLASLAGTMRRRAMSEAAILAGLLEENTNRCKPPLPEEEVRKIAQSVSRYDPDTEADSKGGEEPPGTNTPDDKKPTAGQILLRLIEERGAQFYHGADGEAYVDTTEGEARVTWPVRSRRFRLYLSGRYFSKTKKAISSKTLLDAMNLLEAKAVHEGEEQEIFTRVAVDPSGRVYIDIGDDSWKAVEVVPGSWTIVDEPPVRFRRGKGTYSLPVPEPGGVIADLKPFLNLSTDEDFLLVIAFMVSALRGRSPYPILALHGEQGSGKSTFSRILKSLIDPGKAPLRSEPREIRDLAISAEGSYLLTFDNLSELPRWLSDAFCRLSTGGGFSTRTLYENREEEVFEATRPVILNGITEVLTSGDVIDRAIVLTLPMIGEGARRDEEAFWKAFEEVRPKVLGSLLDTLAGVLEVLPEIRPKRLLRMGDFHRLGLAVERALAWAPGSFEDAYRGNRGAAFSTALEASPAGRAFFDLIQERNRWSGTAQELLRELEKRVEENVRKKKTWPATPRGLSGTLRRLATVLRSMGVEVVFDRAHDRGRDRTIHAEVIEDQGPEAGDPGPYVADGVDGHHPLEEEVA